MTSHPADVHLRFRIRAIAGLALLLLVPGWPTAMVAAATLRAAAGETLIGCAVTSADLAQPALVDLVTTQFSSITAEFEMMPHRIAPEPGTFQFAAADRVVEFAARHRQPVLGHMLVWNYRTPTWLFQEESGAPLSRTRALENLRFYIETVVGHFRGQVAAWNVVNEALSDAPDEFLRDTPARRAIGDDYVTWAFRFAQAADPAAELYYNDYNIEQPGKREKALRLLRDLKAAGVRLDAVGIQGHWLIDHPAVAVIDEGIRAFAAEGLAVMITELDVDVLPRTTSGANMRSVEHRPNPFPQELPPDQQAALARRYAEIFAVFRQHSAITNITFWGTHDGRSWLNDYPVKGRTNHALLFDRNLRPKPAFDAVIAALRRPE